MQSTCAPCSTRSSATSECPGVTAKIKGGPVGVGGERSDVSPPPNATPLTSHKVNVGGVGDVSEHDLDCVLVAIP